MVQISTLRTSFGPIVKLPDPSNLQTAGQWYFLNHVSSPLIQFDSSIAAYRPLYLESWEIDGGQYTLNLKKGMRFHDGKPLTARDVEATIKRQLIKKTATHFPLWNQLEGCDDLKTLEDACSGLVIKDPYTIIVKLKQPSESFLLQISSPETGIWSREDIDAESLEIVPRSFSGPYSAEFTSTGAVLLRNSYSPIQAQFENSPVKIEALALSRKETESHMVKGKLDAFFGDYIPFNSFKWESMDFNVHYTVPSSILYLHRLNLEQQGPVIGMDLLEALWAIVKRPFMVPASTFLPFSDDISLNLDRIKELLPKKTERKTIRIGAFNVYFREELLESMVDAAKEIGIDIVFERFELPRYFEIMKTHSHPEFDFVFSVYAASERYPAVQLRFLSSGRDVGFKLIDADDPDGVKEKKDELVRFQETLLERQMTLPVFFVRSHLVSRKGLDVGEQPVSDLDYHLWKFQQVK